MSDRAGGDIATVVNRPAIALPMLAETAPDSESCDYDLMMAIAKHNETAFEELYDRLASQVFAVCVRILRQPSDAEAVLADVFWEVWCRAERYNPKLASPRTYIMMLARSRAIDRKRVLTREATREGESLDVIKPLASTKCELGPASSAMVAEDCRLLQEALRELTDEQRESIQLAYYEGLTHQEIAERLGKPLGTIKTYIRQAISKLRISFKTLPKTEMPQ